MNHIVAFIAGLLFGAGLVLGGMTQPAIVQAFLDIAGQWNPSLLFVMAAAVLTTMIGYRLVLRRPQPWLEREFHLPKSKNADRKLIVGAALFGIGWGIAGYCPGPALTSLSGGAPSVWLFVAAMAFGWWLISRISSHSAS
ncbi:YeeE/YedE family protein [Dyella sp. 2HG41-7]|uniref:YeeE/YedE family protein n=1 Tax=Dyella sp. 2HG41-7 TaxID=2883239 RepID=UPI001F37D263|nr:YeeE/YedE family protein [Dyella sp. 2HG41-7]